uniref:RRP15-like protein n=1 Tax=Meloidogyne javanica TaxID=6303 RepID=A0A915MIS7_MELJA
MLVEAAAYICNIGNDKSEKDGIDCRKEHENGWDKWKKSLNRKAGEPINEELLHLLKSKTRKLVKEAIIEENKRLISKNVHEAVKEAINLQQIEGYKLKEKMKKKKNMKKSGVGDGGNEKVFINVKLMDED